MNTTSHIDKYLACLSCDLLIEKQELKKGQRAVCPRCQHVLYYSKQNVFSCLALVITASIVYIPAILLPFLSINAGGQTSEISLLGSLAEITQGSSFYLAATVFVLVILIPLIKIVGLLYITLSLTAPTFPLVNPQIAKIILRLSSWGMVEVYLIGVIVTLIKLSSIVDVNFLSGFYVFVCLMLIDTLISLTLPQRRIWQHIGHEK